MGRLFFNPGKGLFGFVPGNLLGRDLGIMSKMFSLRANLWEKS